MPDKNKNYGQRSLIVHEQLRGKIFISSKLPVASQDDLSIAYNEYKQSLLKISNPHDIQGSLQEALAGADVFVGVSAGGILKADDIRTMASDAIVFAMAVFKAHQAES